MDAPPIPEIERERSAFALIGATFSLYRRYSWLFLILAGVVVVPYELISLIGGPDGPVHGVALALVELALSIGDFALVLPLISALHLYALEDVREGREPVLASVARRAVASLRVVSPAVLLSWLGILAGFIALIVPGVLLAIRWAVVAQTGALEAPSWRKALDRSAGLTEKHRKHVLGLFLLTWLITAVPTGIHIAVFGSSTTVGSVFVGTAFAVLVSSFTALATAFLYYDLKARFRTAAATPALKPEPVVTVSGRDVPPTGDPLDPASWGDADRPSGWYVNPDSPWRMRYWHADGAGSWSKRTAKTPKDTLAAWRDLRFVREKAERPEEPV
ncbi:MAG TPA: hypothetical protein VN522_15245 [Solirubrobacterales bacterium]|nr:hypothetical protein [Solirubrobacterales bacterium]